MADKAGGSILRGIVDFGRFGVRQPVAFAGLIALLVGGMAGLGFSQAPSAGLDARVPIGAYLDGNFLPGAGDAMPARLSLTGAFGAQPATPAEMQARIPHPGLVPYEINSALWTDAAIKERFIALPYGGTTGSPRIGFQPTGSWTYPAGTVIVKNFDMQLDEQTNTPATIRRLETRILVRNADGGVRGATYKWRADYTDADLVPTANTESLVIKGADGLNRSQPYLYPGPAECLRCHTENAGLMLGIKTAQLNGNFTYTTPNPPRIDNQLNTWERVGMFDQALLADLSAYDKMVDVMDTTATLEHRVRSYLSSNCAHCHMPGGEGPLFDMRYETPVLSQNIVGARGNLWGGLIRDNLAASRIFVRDKSNIVMMGGMGVPGIGPMPPLARNVPDQRIIGPGALYEQWVNYPFDVLSVRANSRTQVRVQFDRPLDPVTAGNAANFAIDGGVTVSAAVPDTDPSAVLLTTTPLAYSTTYAVTVNRVREQAAPKNPVWPNTQAQFVSPAPPTVPGAPVIAVAGAGNAQVTLTVTPPASDGGSAITGYSASCSPGPVTASGTVMPVVTISVSPLINGTQYSCTVRAINAIGASAASDPVLVTPFTVPGPPVIMSVLPGNGSASITFTAPGSNGGAPITGYTATCLPGPVTAAGTASPIVVTGLTNEQPHTCTIKATNAAGDSAPSSPPVAVTPTAAVPPVLLTVLSRKTHGTAGDFDIEINRPPANALTVEPRGIGSGHRVVFQFDRAITAAGSLTVLDAAGAPIGSATASVSGNNMMDVIVVLTGIPDNQRVTISLAGVNAVGVASVSMGFLVGDINDSQAVNAGDILAVKARPGLVGNGNFRFDLNVSGSVDARDLSMAKARAGLMLP